MEIASQRLQRSSTSTPGSDALRSIDRSRSSTSASVPGSVHSREHRSPPSPLNLEHVETPVLDRFGLRGEARTTQTHIPLGPERRLDELVFGDEDEGESLYIGKPTR